MRCESKRVSRRVHEVLVWAHESAYANMREHEGECMPAREVKEEVELMKNHFQKHRRVKNASKEKLHCYHTIGLYQISKNSRKHRAIHLGNLKYKRQQGGGRENMLIN